jgi:hemerythrin-like domain-containing protein
MIMKRIPALRRLSADHHRGLVLARQARTTNDPSLTWAEIQHQFRVELDPHFELEENGLLPALSAVGELELVERTLAEHRAMRALIATGGPADLERFAALLDDHIRFEEAVLFETAQRLLSSEVLARIQDLHEQAAAPSCTIRSAAP